MTFNTRSEVGKWANNLSDEKKATLVKVARIRLQRRYKHDAELRKIVADWSDTTVVDNLLSHNNDCLVLEMLLGYYSSYTMLENEIRQVGENLDAKSRRKFRC